MVGEAKENHSEADRVVQGPYLLTVEFENPQPTYFNPPKNTSTCLLFNFIS